MAYDFYRGGVHVLTPAQKIQSVYWAEQQIPSNPEQSSSGSTSLDPVQARDASAYEWYSAPSNSYLWKHEREKIWEYNRRAGAAYHIPLFRPLINILASAVLKTGPEREVPATWDQYLEDVNLNGAGINQFAREALTVALTFGRAHAITDLERPSSNAPILSLEDQRARGIRAYSYLILPFDLIDWALDDKGNFIWAVIREDAPDVRLPGEKQIDNADQYRVWYPDKWELYRSLKERGGQFYELVDTSFHPLGRVPIQTLYAHRGNRTIFGCESPLSDMVDIDRKVFNYLSLLDEILLKQTFSILAVPRRDGGPIGDFELAPGCGLLFDSEAGAPLFLSPDTDQARVIWEIITGLFSTARVQSEVGRGEADESKEARSAAAISAESGDKHNVMSSLAESVETFERGLYASVAAWEGLTDVPKVNYSRKFDLRSINQQIADLAQLGAAQVSARARAILAKPIVGKFMQELGASDSEVDAAKNATEIDEPVKQDLQKSISSSDDQADKRADTE